LSRFLFSFFVLLLAWRPCFSQTVLSLDDCLRLATGAKSQVDVARQQLAATGQGVRQAAADFLPQARLLNAYNYNSPLQGTQDQFSFVALNGIREYVSQFTVAQEFDVSGRLRGELDRAKAERQAGTEFLRLLPARFETEVEGTRFYLCHAIPSDPLYGYCEPDSDQWVEEVERLKADVLLVGHTHLPFIRRAGACTIVNPGSLGQPKTGQPNACYAVWHDGDVELKSYSYPLESTITKIHNLPIPPEIRDDLTSVLRTGGSPG